jgi:MYXO-CTERM domain-containing protein
VSDGFRITRWDLDVSSGNVVATRGLDIPASPGGVGATDESNTLTFDGVSNLGFVGGRVVGDLYTFDARLDAGPPTVFDAALVSQGRLSAPVTGLAVYSGQNASYLLAANGQGVTVYNLLLTNPRPTAFRVIPEDTLGQITAPAGVAVTNLPAGAALPGGVIAVGDRTQTDLALVRWDILAGQVDGGLVVDPNTDPRDGGPRGDGGQPDGGPPDGGNPPSGPGPGGGALGPGIPVDHSSSCAAAPGGPALLALLTGLGLLVPRRRQRR